MGSSSPRVASARGCQALPNPRAPASSLPPLAPPWGRARAAARPGTLAGGSGEPGASAGARQVRKRTHGRAHTHGAMSLRSCLPAAHSAGFFFFPLLANQLLKEELPQPGQRCAPRPAQLRCGGGKWAWNSRRLTEEHSTRLHSLSTDIWNSHCGRKQNQTKAPKLLPPSEALTASAARGHSSPRARARRRRGSAGGRAVGMAPAAPPRWARTPGLQQRARGGSACDTGLPTRPARPGNRFILLCLFSERTAETGRAPGQAELRQLPSEQEHS